MAHRFNSRPHVAGDPTPATSPRAARPFQFTPARGGRRQSSAMRERSLSFQFAPARGGRPSSTGIESSHSEFQYSRARGGRRGPRPTSHPPCARFNSRPHVAGDLRPRRDLRDCAGFNSRPHVAGDKKPLQDLHAYQRFNSRPHVAGDTGTPHAARADRVSIHARTWRATQMRQFRHHS